MAKPSKQPKKVGKIIKPTAMSIQITPSAPAAKSNKLKIVMMPMALPQASKALPLELGASRKLMMKAMVKGMDRKSV